jgi:hypothetical protein
MKKLLLLLSFICSGTFMQAQIIDTINRDTIFVIPDVKNPIEISKGRHKYLYIRNIIPQDIPAKQLKIQVISSKSTELDIKQIQIVGLDMIFPLSLFEEKFYNLYIKKGNDTYNSKRILIR